MDQQQLMTNSTCFICIPPGLRSAIMLYLLGSISDAGASSAKLYSGHGSPNGVQTGNVGDLYTDLDTGAIWPKISGTATNTGWGT